MKPDQTTEPDSSGACAGSLPPLTEWQEKKLYMLSRGYALDASPRGWGKEARRLMEDLVTRGLVRKTSPSPWAKHGAYVKAENARGETRRRRSESPTDTELHEKDRI